MEKALAAAYNRDISRQTTHAFCPRTIYDAEITGFLDQHYSSSLIPHGENFVIRCNIATHADVEVCINSFNFRCVEKVRTDNEPGKTYIVLQWENVEKIIIYYL